MNDLWSGERIFADSSALIAAWSRRDRNHRSAIKFLKKDVSDLKLRLVITNFVFAEIHAYFCRFPEFARQVGNAILVDPLFSIERAEKLDEDQAWNLIQEHADKTYTFTDAVSFVVMERLKLRSAFAFDKHFKQDGRFRLLP